MIPELVDALADALQQAGPASRAIVLTGAAPAFCVGADLKWLAAEPDPGEAVARLLAAHHTAIRAIRGSPIPVVAAVNGAAAGGGMSLALACDYLVASQQATFTAAYFRLGLPPDGGNSALLVRSLGLARTMQLLLTNRRLTADEALAWGLVNEIAAPDALVERACTLAASFEPVPSETLVATRRLLDSATTQSLDAQLDAEAAAMCSAARQEAFREAIQRFLRR
jgi:2-(1,2-epoxy-1,2-dihydrophenyl)acetyl-CoA isomerase